MTQEKNKDLRRCEWVILDDPLYVDYHDNEWGKPVHEDRKHFEFLCLEGAQAGLSWRTILHKRKGYQLLFDNFDPERVARYDEKKILALLADPRIIRNRAKIQACITNAQIFLDIQSQLGSFDSYIWQFNDGKTLRQSFASPTDYPTENNLSRALSTDLKQRGMRFVGSTIMYSHLQACGIINDHEARCFCSTP